MSLGSSNLKGTGQKQDIDFFHIIVGSLELNIFDEFSG